MNAREAVRQHWVQDPPRSTSQGGDESLSTSASNKDDEIILQTKKKLESMLAWDIVDEKHRALVDIKKTIGIMLKLHTNVRDNPEDERVHRVRMSSNLFAKYVRDLPKNVGWEFMVATGWRVTTIDYERYFVYPKGSDLSPLQEKILNTACDELERCNASLGQKLERQEVGNTRADLEARRQIALLAIKDDSQRRQERFR